MKKICSIMFAIIFVVLILTGCESSQVGSSVVNLFKGNNAGGEEKTKVVSTIFPPYDFVRNIAGDNVDLSMLLSPGAESHSFEPSSQDIVKIQNSDVFIYVGGENDKWVEKALESVDTNKTKVVSLLEMVDTVEVKVVEGMENYSHGVEFDESNVDARPLSDWNGEWTSVVKSLNEGALDDYITLVSSENNIGLEDVKNAQLEKWDSKFDQIKITDGKTVEFSNSEGTNSGEYEYISLKVIKGDHGYFIWHQFELKDDNDKLPKYIVFSDHSACTGNDAHVHNHDDDHSHEGEPPHYYIRYGDNGFDELINAKNWLPTFFDSNASGEEINKTLTAHFHPNKKAEIDEHVWTSPANAKTIVAGLTNILSEIDGDKAVLYKANSESYLGKLDELDESFKVVMSQANRKTLVFGDRFPFRYFTDAYGLDYYAAFSNCSTDTEPSASAVEFLIDKIRTENIPAVFYMEFSNEAIADAISNETGAKKLLLHSCHNVSWQDFENNVGYIDLMNSNVEKLKEALL